MALSAPLDGPGPGGPPAVVEDAAGVYSVSWPHGRPAEFPIGSAFFERLVEEANLGTRAVTVFGVIAEAMGRLNPRPSTST